jgi:hypothetical protein
VVPRGLVFQAALLHLDAGNHVILINQDSLGDQLVYDVAHELGHYAKHCKKERQQMHTNAKSIEAGSGRDTAMPQSVILFASAQLHVDADDKRLAARWVAEDLPLTNGAGLFLDAGVPAWSFGKRFSTASGITVSQTCR